MAKYIKTEKRVYLGQRCQLHPSMGWAGIEHGYVKVDDFISWEEIPKFIDKEVYADGMPEVRNEYWVKYHYTDKKHVEYGQENFLPASVFAEHCTIY